MNTKRVVEINRALANIEIVAKHAISSLEELSNAIEVFEKNIENMKKVKRDIDKEVVLTNIPNLPGI